MGPLLSSHLEVSKLTSSSFLKCLERDFYILSQGGGGEAQPLEVEPWNFPLIFRGVVKLKHPTPTLFATECTGISLHMQGSAWSTAQ